MGGFIIITRNLGLPKNMIGRFWHPILKEGILRPSAYSDAKFCESNFLDAKYSDTGFSGGKPPTDDK